MEREWINQTVDYSWDKTGDYPSGSNHLSAVGNIFDCCVAHTGQNYDKNLNDIFWSDFELGGPDVWMNVVGENLGQTCGNVIARSYELMTEIKPDALLVLGDTNSCLSAISAKRLHIPIFPYGSRKQMQG